MARGGSGEVTDWVTRAADDAIRHYEAGGGEGVLTVASGASPSGPVHLGNLREFITPHFVAEELRRRGVDVRHLHSWDDYDRFRKVPKGAPAEWADHIGRPLTGVPDPWDCHPTWSDHFKEPLRNSLHEMGIEMQEISQTEMYTSGAYRDQILLAVERRADIEAVLAQHRTKQATPAEGERGGEDDAEAAALAESVANAEETSGTGALARFPVKPWCGNCGRDTTEITNYDDASTVLAYTCQVCHFTGSTNLSTENAGKLVWKVDWPMRWAYEKVNFEPGGLDHMTPGSSYTVGQALVGDIFGWRTPARVIYGFVGFAGVQKMSSSAGNVPTAADALRILEAPMLRWLYVRRQPKQTFTIDFGPEVVRLYDEWDALTKKAATKKDVATLAWERSVSTASAGTLPTAKVPVPFRTLSSVADVTAGSAELISNTISHVGFPHDSVDDLQPRLDKARQWTTEFVPAEDRTTVRESADAARIAILGETEREWLRLLIDGLSDPLDQDAVTALVYGVPKLARGMSVDDAPTDEVKADQKEFFKLLYNLLVDADRGPRLPTLIVALGAERVKTLLNA